MGIDSGYGIGSLKTGVCTSTTRPAVPFEGQTIYETDTDKLLVYNATAWKQVPTAATAGAVLQVVQGTTTTSTSNSTATMADTTLTASITPSSSSSKVLVFANHPGSQKANGNVNNALLLKLFRGATELAFNNSIGASTTAQELIFSTSFLVLDSPATTSATTYKTQFSNAIVAASVTVQFVSIPSTIILMEISA